MEALSGGNIVHVYHARVVCSDMRYGVHLAIAVTKGKLQQLRNYLKDEYNAEAIYLSYEEQ